jgi:hypothetical protein
MVATINALCAVIVGGCEDLQTGGVDRGNGVHGRKKPTIAAKCAAIVATSSLSVSASLRLVLCGTVGSTSDAARAAVSPSGIPGGVLGWLRVFAFRR